MDDIDLQQNGPILTVILNRPEMHNALKPAMVEALTTLFRGLESRNDIRVVILTGNGRSFCAGADLASMRAAADDSFAQNRAGGEAIFDMMRAANECCKPLLGRVNGAAIGGGLGLVSCCDIVVSVDRAKFALSEVRLGILPAVISPFVLAKIGEGAARELFLTGERFDAHYAQRIGLVHHVVSEEELNDKVAERLERLLKAAPGAQSAAKELIRNVRGRPVEAVRDYTATMIAQARASDEGREGMSAFLEKRKPQWLGGGHD